MEIISGRDKFDFDKFIEYYDYEACEIEQDEDDDWDEEIRSREEQISAGPPSNCNSLANHGNKSARSPVSTLPKSVQDSLDGLANLYGQSKKYIKRLANHPKLN